MRRMRAAMVAVVLAGVLPVAGAGAAPAAKGGPPRAGERPGRRFVIAGSIVDTRGLPVGDLPVQVQAADRPLSKDPRLDANRYEVVAEGTTADDGSYRVEFPVASPGRKYYVSFFAFGKFDDVRYARPERVDITDKVARSGALLLDHRLSRHAEWAKVQKLLKAYPPDSARARVIRRYGVAEEIVPKKDASGVEIWWYYSKGKKFSFRGEKLVDEDAFAPVLK